MDITNLISLCTSYISSLDIDMVTLIPAMLIAGLTGGILHCSYMCSPFLMMQISYKLSKDSSENISELTRLKHSLLIPYHLGRMTTYSILGALTAFLTGYISGWWENISAILLMLAGVFMLAYSSNIIIKYPAIKIFSNIVKPRGKTILSGYLTGIMLGFLPCGMLYSAILTASSTGNPYYGALLMIFFSLGTIPGLFISAFSGHYIIGKIRNRYNFIPKIIIFITGLWLCYLSFKIFTT